MLNETTAGVSVNPFMSGRIRSILEGDSKEWYPNGQKASECTWKDGEREGTVTSWDEVGNRSKL